jgi:hypothetical protein
MTTKYTITAQLHGGEYDGQLVDLPLPFRAFDLEGSKPVGGTIPVYRYLFGEQRDGLWHFNLSPGVLIPPLKVESVFGVDGPGPALLHPVSKPKS